MDCRPKTCQRRAGSRVRKPRAGSRVRKPRPVEVEVTWNVETNPIDDARFDFVHDVFEEVAPGCCTTGGSTPKICGVELEFSTSQKLTAIRKLTMAKLKNMTCEVTVTVTRVL